MSRHTPGPWQVPHFATDSPCECRSVVALACYPGAICEIFADNGKSIGDGGNGAPPLEQAKANARLIAAAPDLLAACKLAIAAIKGREHTGFLEDAIAKATAT